MIEPEDYKFPHREEPKPQPKADPATLAYMESMPWRPFTDEW